MGNRINRTELEAKLRGLEGLSQDEKSALIELLHQKRYGLVWENKPEDVEEKLRMEIPVLKERKELALTQGGEDAPNHILIEGDNLEALTALSYTHENAIDVIYIDPPYNTGKKFIYNDSNVDEDDEYKHSKWCSFIEKRLKISKLLLSSRGVIMISIDNHEFHTLKLICDELFGEKNLMTVFVWKTEGNTDNQAIITDVHEYILCYALRKSNVIINNVVDPNIDQSSKIYRDFVENSIVKNGSKNPPSEVILPIGFPCECEKLYIPSMNCFAAFKEEVKRNGFISRELTKKYNAHYPINIDDLKVEDYKTIETCRMYSGWSNNSKLKRFIDNLCQPIRDEGTYLKFFLSKTGVITYRKEGRESCYVQSVLQNMGTTETNKYMLEKMNLKFDFPKPIELIKYLLSVFSKKDSVILDYFAGSGTTMHATMLQNEIDGGKRQCILIQNDSNGICKTTYNRNAYVIKEQTELPNKEKIYALSYNNLRYYQVDSIPRESSITVKREFMKASTDLLCIKNDIYREVEILGEWKMRANVARFFEEGERRMLIIYTEDVFERIVEELKRVDVKEKILVYVFSVNNYAMDADFEEVADKVQLCALPAAIYNAYLKVLPKKRIVKQTTEEENV